MTSPRSWSAWLWAAAPVAIIYLAHLWYGANTSLAALSLVACEGLLLLAFLCRPAFRGVIARIGKLSWVAMFFALALAASVLSLVPFVPGGPHPIWSYVSAVPAGTIDRASSMAEIFKLLGLACVFLLGCMLGGSQSHSKQVRTTLVGAGAIFAILALMLYLGRNPGTAGARLTANLTSANCAATVFGVLGVLTLSLFSSPRQYSQRGRRFEALILAYGPAVGLLLLFFTCLILTASRGGLFAAAAATAVFLLLQVAAGRMRLRTLGVVITALTLIGAGLLLLKGGLILERFGDTSLTSNDRTPMFALHWRAFLQSPITGYGLGTFAKINHLLLDAQTYSHAWTVRDLHNVYLQWIEEAGVVGAISMFACIGLIIGAAALGLRQNRRDAVWARALLAADVVVLCHGTTDFALQVPSIAAMWSLLLGLHFGGASLSAASRRRA